MENVWLAIVALAGGVITSIATPIVLYILAAKTKKLDWARQDQVAAQALQASTEAAANAQVTHEKLDTIENQGDAIHKLVNSQLSAAIQAEHDALVGQLAGLREIVALRRNTPDPTGSDTDNVIQTIETRLVELKNLLIERAEKSKP